MQMVKFHPFNHTTHELQKSFNHSRKTFWTKIWDVGQNRVRACTGGCSDIILFFCQAQFQQADSIEIELS